MAQYLSSSSPAKNRQAMVIYGDSKYMPFSVYVAFELLRLRADRPVDIVLLTHETDQLEIASQIVPEARVVSMSADLQSFGHSAPAPEGMLIRSFLNLYAPHVFEGEYDRLMMVDSDYIIQNDQMFRLFDLDMQGYALAAMQDIISIAPEFAQASVPRYFRPARMSPDLPYLNGGFQIIDCAAWLGQEIAEKAVADTTALPGPRYFGDQRALNCILQGEWLELSPNCNWATVWPKQRIDQAYYGCILSGASGIHMLGASKPWREERPRRIHPDHYDHMRGFFAGTAYDSVIPEMSLEENRRILAVTKARGLSAKDLFPEQVRQYLVREFADTKQGLAPEFSAFQQQLRD